MIDWASLEGFPPLARLLTLAGLYSPEGKLTGLMTLAQLSRRTGIAQAQIPEILAQLPPEVALYVPSLEVAIFPQRARAECKTWKVWVGALNKLEGHDPLVVVLWAELHREDIERLTEKGRQVIMGRLNPYIDLVEKAQEIIRGARMHGAARIEAETTHNNPPFKENRENTPILEPHRKGYINPSGRWPREIKAKARELWETTRLTASEIAKELGIPQARVITNWAYFEGWPKRRGGRNDKDWEALRARVIDLREQGLSLREIMFELNGQVSWGFIARWAKASEVEVGK